MKTVIIYGVNDDLIYFENIDSASFADKDKGNPMGRNEKGELGAEFYPSALGKRGLAKALFSICDKVLVYVTYGGKGIWRFAVSRVEEDDDYPGWPIGITTHRNGYSMQVEIDIPSDTKVHIQELEYGSDR